MKTTKKIRSLTGNTLSSFVQHPLIENFPGKRFWQKFVTTTTCSTMNYETNFFFLGFFVFSLSRKYLNDTKMHVRQHRKKYKYVFFFFLLEQWCIKFKRIFFFFIIKKFRNVDDLHLLQMYNIIYIYKYIWE